MIILYAIFSVFFYIGGGDSLIDCFFPNIRGMFTAITVLLFLEILNVFLFTKILYSKENRIFKVISITSIIAIFTIIITSMLGWGIVGALLPMTLFSIFYFESYVLQLYIIDLNDVKENILSSIGICIIFIFFTLVSMNIASYQEVVPCQSDVIPCETITVGW